MNTTLKCSLVALCLLPACRPAQQGAALKEGETPAADAGAVLTPGPNDISEAKWRNKVSQRLRYGSRITDEEEEKYKALSRQQFIDEMMKDPRFALTLLDFNMDFLGRQVDSLVEQAPVTPAGNNPFPEFSPAAAATGMEASATAAPTGPNPQLNASVFSQPQALAGAMAAMNGGDFFELFDGNPKLYVESPVQVSNSATFAADLEKEFNSVIAMFGAPPSDSMRAVGCQSTPQLARKLSLPTNKSGGGDAYAALKMEPSVRYVLNLIGQNWVGSIQRQVPVGDFNNANVGDCNDPAFTAQALADRLTKIRDETMRIFAEIEAKKKTPSSQPVNDMIALDVNVAGLPALNPAFTYEGQWKIVKNSSTNVNRKRAAYILRTFTCDDMTPVSLGSTDHVEGAHSAAAACQACHYKMDPIGAIFAPHGVAGISFKKQKNHIYDDALNVAKDSDHYTKKYVNEYNGTDGKIKIGHYKSPTKLYPEWTEANPDDVTMSTMFDYFKKSKVVRSCLTKRLTEYVLGKKQVYDGKWVDSLAKNFDGGDATAALKKSISDLLLSKTFNRASIVPGQCYDYAVGAEPGPDAAPCEVNSIAVKYCASCHNEDSPNGDLDMTKFVSGPQGAMFAHYMSEGVLFDRTTSLKWMLASITDPKSIKRDRDGDGQDDELLPMPYKKDFPESEKQIFFKWLQKQLSESTGN